MWAGSWQGYLYCHLVLLYQSQIFGPSIHLTMMLEQNNLRLMPKYQLYYNHYLVILLKQVTVTPFLQVGLACVLHHKTSLNKTFHKCHSIVKLTAIYTSLNIVDIEHFFSVRVPFDEGNFAIQLTGIPPHVAHLAAISGLKGDIAKIVPSLLMEIQKMLDDRTFEGILSETRMQALFEKLSCLGFTVKVKGCTIKAHETKLICFVVPLVALLFIHILACFLENMPSGI